MSDYFEDPGQGGDGQTAYGIGQKNTNPLLDNDDLEQIERTERVRRERASRGIGAKNTNRRSWVEARRKVDREAECRLCGAIHNLQAAHVVPRSLGGGQSEDSIVPLCPTCHRDFDRLEIDIIPALTYEEQAEAVRVLGIERARERLSGKLRGGPLGW